jgi:hypothetical protein
MSTTHKEKQRQNKVERKCVVRLQIMAAVE